MALVSENAVSDIIVMRNLNIVEENDIFQFCAVADHTVIAYQRAATDKCTGTDFCFVTDNGRCPDIIVRIDFGIFRDPDIFADFVKFIGGQGLSTLDDEFLDFS